MSEVVLWPVIHGSVQRVAYLHLLGLCDDSLDEGVVYALLYKYSTRRDTVLSLVEEHSAHRLGKREELRSVIAKFHFHHSVQEGKKNVILMLERGKKHDSPDI